MNNQPSQASRLREFADWLQRWAAYFQEQASLAEAPPPGIGEASASQALPGAGRPPEAAAPGGAGHPAERSGEPPEHWLAAARSPGPPAHWLALFSEQSAGLFPGQAESGEPSQPQSGEAPPPAQPHPHAQLDPHAHLDPPAWLETLQRGASDLLDALTPAEEYLAGGDMPSPPAAGDISTPRRQTASRSGGESLASDDAPPVEAAVPEHPGQPAPQAHSRRAGAAARRAAAPPAQPAPAHTSTQKEPPVPPAPQPSLQAGAPSLPAAPRLRLRTFLPAARQDSASTEETAAAPLPEAGGQPVGERGASPRHPITRQKASTGEITAALKDVGSETGSPEQPERRLASPPAGKSPPRKRQLRSPVPGKDAFMQGGSAPALDPSPQPGSLREAGAPVLPSSNVTPEAVAPVARRTRLRLAPQAAREPAAAGRQLFAALPGSPPQAVPAPQHAPPVLQQVRAGQASLPPAADLSASPPGALPLPQAALAASQAPQAASAGERFIPGAEIPAAIIAAPELNQSEPPAELAAFSQPVHNEQALDSSQPQPVEIPASFSVSTFEPPVQQAAAAYSASRLADLWPALPDTWEAKPAQPARLSQDAHFRQRLDREQRGRAWNE